MSFPQRNPFADEAPNPYAPPLAPPQVQPQYQPDGSPYAGLWRAGDVLIMHKLAPLPQICVKSNEPATTWLKRKLRWQEPAVTAGVVIAIVFAGILGIIGAIIVAILAKKATINIGLTDEWAARRRTRLIIAWGTGILGIVLVVGSIVALVTSHPGDDVVQGIGGLGALLGFFMLLGGAIFGQYACRLIYASKMTDTHIWIKGVHPGFLDRLPVWYG